MNLGVPMHVVHGFPVTVMTGEPKTLPVLPGETPKKYRHAIFDNINWRDKNAEWLTYYSFTIVNSEYSYYESENYHYKISETGFNALPFYGKGSKARKIGAALLTYEPSAVFNLGVYSATASGLPGNEISGASAQAMNGADFELTWADVDVKLNKGREYFIAVSCQNEPCYGGWYFEDTNFKTAQDYWHVKEYETYNYGSGTSTYSYSSPWHLSTAYHEQGAAIILK
jgi:hypothetical protein